MRSAFARIFGSFPAVVYLWIGMGLFSSILVIISVVAPSWLSYFGIPFMIAVPIFQTAGEGVQALMIWVGYPLTALFLLSAYMLWRRR